MNRSLLNVIFGGMGTPNAIVGKGEVCDVQTHQCHQEIDVNGEWGCWHWVECMLCGMAGVVVYMCGCIVSRRLRHNTVQ